MHLLRLLLQQSWVTVLLATATGLLGGGATAGLIALINLAIQQTPHPSPWLGLGFIGLCGAVLVTTAASQIMMARLAQAIIFDLRLGLTRQILDCPLRRLEELGAPRLLGILTKDVEAIASASGAIAGLALNLALILACLLYLLWLSPPIFISLIGLLFLGVYLYAGLTRRGRVAVRLARLTQDRLFQHFDATLRGTKELKLHAQRRQSFLTEEMEPTAAALQRHWLEVIAVYATSGSVGLILFFIPIGLIVFLFPYWMTLPATTLASYAVTILFMITPLRNMTESMPLLSQANVALETVKATGLELASQTPPSLPASPASPNSTWHTLKLVGITHTYLNERGDHPFTLGPLDLTLQAGEIVFIVGGNGSGKSTLIKIITGLYIPETGAIYLDHQPITPQNQDAYRQNFAAVFADFYLFDRFLGLDTATLTPQAQTYLTQLELDRAVHIRDGQLTTLNLSQGQRKRLALLTAYLEDRPIYVFDEWASDQDPIFKAVFYTQLLPALKQRGKTVLVVSHDDRYFPNADRLIKLDYGQIQENS